MNEKINNLNVYEVNRLRQQANNIRTAMDTAIKRQSKAGIPFTHRDSALAYETYELAKLLDKAADKLFIRTIISHNMDKKVIIQTGEFAELIPDSNRLQTLCDDYLNYLIENCH